VVQKLSIETPMCVSKRVN